MLLPCSRIMEFLEVPLWILLGGATTRTLREIDKRTGQETSLGAIREFLSDIESTLLGGITFYAAISLWLEHAAQSGDLIYEIREVEGFSPYRLLLGEIIATFLACWAFLLLNAFF